MLINAYGYDSKLLNDLVAQEPAIDDTTLEWIRLERTATNKIQKLSIRNQKILAYYEATIDRITNNVEQVFLVKFKKVHNAEDALIARLDLEEFMSYLIKTFTTVEFSCRKAIATRLFESWIVEYKGQKFDQPQKVLYQNKRHTLTRYYFCHDIGQQP